MKKIHRSQNEKKCIMLSKAQWTEKEIHVTHLARMKHSALHFRRLHTIQR